MFHKKIYQKASHYEYRLIEFPKKNGGKTIAYFRRYRSAEQQKQKNNLYDILNKQAQIFKQQVPQKNIYNRVLQVINFDSAFQEAELKKLFHLLGKVRKVEIGQTKQKGKNIFFGLITFKFEFDLIKAFHGDYFQNKINQSTKQIKIKQNKQDKEEYMFDIIQKYAKKQQQNLKSVEKLKSEGYNIVTGKFGNFQVNHQLNDKWVQQLPQVKKKRKLN